MNTNIISSKVMLIFHIYSCAKELEYSFHVITLIYELAYSLCIMILTCSFDMIIAYELDYSFNARVLSYRTLCFFHAIYLLRLELSTGGSSSCLRVCPCPMLIDP
jgi:hypothetical protein